MIKRCNDFGAGGVSVAIGELADGLKIDLDKVPKKYDGLDGTELAISESQERMAVVLDKADVDTFIKLSNEENLEATPVAVVTDENRLEMTWRGDKIVDLSRDFLNTNGVTQHAKVEISAVDENKNYRKEVPAALDNLSLANALKANLSRLEVCSQKGLVERFDSSIGASTVLTVPLLPEWTQLFRRLNALSKNLAAQNENVTYVPIPFAMTATDAHPTVSGHKYIANRILRAIKK